MQIIAISDLHGEMTPAKELVTIYKPDILLCCGDWGDPGQVEKVDFEALAAQTYVLSVFGNHDDLDLLKSLQNTDGSPVLLNNAEIRDISGIKIAGINGIWAKSHRNPWYITDEEIIAAGEALEDKSIDILLTHGCAVGLCDIVAEGRHGGQMSFLEAVQKVKPRLYLCGHLHNQQMKTYGDSLIAANVGHTANGDYLLIEPQANAWSVEARNLQTEVS